MLKTSKKVISIILAVVLAFSVMSVAAFAAFDSSTQKLGLILVPDKDLTKLAPGDEVTFTMYCDVADFDTLFGAYKIPVFFDPAVYTADNAYTLYNDFANFYKPTSVTTIVTAAAAVSKIASYASNIDTARHTAFVNFLGTADTGLGGTNTGGHKMTPAEEGGTRTGAELSFKMTVKADADLVNGNTDVVIPDAFSYVSGMYFKTTNGSKTSFLTNAQVNTEASNAMANNPAVASPAVTKYKTQVKFTGDKTTAPDDLFQFRLTSVITAADFAAMNSNGNTIKSVGFIAANTGAADADAAKTAVEKGTALPSAWKTASTDYVSQANASSDAYFGAIVKNISHASQATDIDCIAYVCYNDGTADHYVWYSAAVTAKVASGYDAAVAAWKAQ